MKCLSLFRSKPKTAANDIWKEYGDMLTFNESWWWTSMFFSVFEIYEKK